MAEYKRYQKLQKYYLGVPVEPAEYKEGDLIDIKDYNSIKECEKYTPQITYNNWVVSTSSLVRKYDGFTINSLGTDDDGLYHFTIEGAGTELGFYSNVIYSHYVDLTNITDLSLMGLCNPDYIGGNFSGWNTSNVTNMSNLFKWATSLTKLDISSFDTSNVTTMESMFDNCPSLKTLDLSNFDTSNVTDMRYMFQTCSSLTTLDISSFNTSKVTLMSYMFNKCSSLTTLDLSNFNTSNVTDTRYMFLDCSSLRELNISGWDLTKAISYSNIGRPFMGCTSLQKIYAYGCNEATINCIIEELSREELTDQVTIITQ